MRDFACETRGLAALVRAEPHERNEQLFRGQRAVLTDHAPRALTGIPGVVVGDEAARCDDHVADAAARLGRRLAEALRLKARRQNVRALATFE